MDRSTAVCSHTCPSFPRSGTRATSGLPGRQTEAPSIRLPHNQQARSWGGLWPWRVLGRVSPHSRILPPSSPSREDRASSSCRGPVCQADGLETRIYQSRPGPATLTHDPFGSGWKGPFQSISPTGAVSVSCFLLPVSPSCHLNSQFALNVPRPLQR